MEVHRGRLKDLPLDELHPVTLAEHAGGHHGVVLLDGEAPAYGLHSHSDKGTVASSAG